MNGDGAECGGNIDAADDGGAANADGPPRLTLFI